MHTDRNKIVSCVLYIYLCLVMGIHSGVNAHLPVGVFPDLGHDQLGVLNVCLRRVVEGCIITLGLLVATHGQCFDIEHSFRCWVQTLWNMIAGSPVGCGLVCITYKCATYQSSYVMCGPEHFLSYMTVKQHFLWSASCTQLAAVITWTTYFHGDGIMNH